MDSGETCNVGRPPLFNGLNYTYWKSHMQAFLWSLADHIWFLIENNWTYTTKILPKNIVILKPNIDWTKKSKESEWNSKCLYAIIKVITHDDYIRIQRCTTSK